MSDYRSSTAARRQSWFGLKQFVKVAASYPLPHAALRAASRVVPSLRSGRLPAPKGLAEVTGVIDGATFTMLRPDRCENAKELYWGNGRRPKAADAFTFEVFAKLVRDAAVFVDVGAYTGLFSLAATALDPKLVAHAFEIVPAVAVLLEENARRNGVSERLFVHREGIGAPGATMVVPAGSGGSALPSFYSSRMHFDSGERVSFRSLDSLDALIGGDDQRVVVKIDVEGTEDDVLSNGRTFLAERGPDIVCEVLHDRADVTALNDVLLPLGYNFYLLREHDLYHRASLLGHPRYRDWLLTRMDAGALHGRGIDRIAGAR